MSSDGSGGIDLGSGATGNLGGGSTPSGFTMPDGSGNTLFSMPGGGAAVPGSVQPNPFSMGQGVMNSGNLSGIAGQNAQLQKLLSAAGKGTAPQQAGGMQSGMGGGHGSGGAVNFMPSSAITLPYSLSTGGTQSLLNQILQRANSNPSAMG